MTIKRYYVEVGEQSYGDLVIVIIRVVIEALNKNLISSFVIVKDNTYHTLFLSKI